MQRSKLRLPLHLFWDLVLLLVLLLMSSILTFELILAAYIFTVQVSKTANK